MKHKGIEIGQHTIIKEDVKVGKGSKVWHFCNLYDCEIGENTQIGSYCEIKGKAVIGNNCRLQSYVFVSDGTKIGNNVFVGPKVAFLNAKYITAQMAIDKDWELEAVVVEDGVSIGGGVTILPGVKIGGNAVIGAGSVVTKDVPPYALVYGNPARVIGDIRDNEYSYIQGKSND